MLVVNFFGGPGSGKSTTAAGLFYNLKMFGCNCELVTEIAKDLTWEGRHRTLENQVYVFGKQVQKLHRLKGQVDVAITDSPIFLSSIYAPKDYPKSFNEFVLHLFNSMNNLNFYKNRNKEYNSAGRSQTKEEAVKIDNLIKQRLREHDIQFALVEGNRQSITTMTSIILNKIRSHG